jgi:hypothetical protein
LASVPTPKTKLLPTPDVLYIRTRSPAPSSFLPLVEQPSFWIGQAIPASGLLLLGLGLLVRNARIATQPYRVLNREKRLLWKKIDASNNRPDVLQAAVRLLELNSGNQTRGKATGLQSLNEAISTSALPEDLRGEVRALLEVREATVYGHVGSDSLTEDERSKIKTILNRWRSAA